MNTSRLYLPLAISQTLLWASTYYLLPALLPVLERDSGWSKAEISAGLTLALLVSAATSTAVGRGIDRGWGRQIMVTSAIFSALLLLAFSYAQSVWQFYAIWIAMGVCFSSMLYEPCFSIVTRHLGNDARPMITRITLIAGFAGTISFPAANYLASTYDWQTAVRVFAGVVLFIATPLAWQGVSRLQSALPAKASPKSKVARALPPGFWYLALAFTFGSLCHGMVMTHLLPLIGERGIGNDLAVLAATVVGPMQVVGRLVLMRNEARVSTRASVLICILGLACSGTLLYIAGAVLPIILLATAVHGATWGLVSIARPAITRERLGSEGFGAISGRMASIVTLGLAVAPSMGALLWGIGGYDLMLIVGIALSLAGALLLWLGTRPSA